MLSKNVARHFEKRCPCFFQALPMFFYCVAHRFWKLRAIFFDFLVCLACNHLFSCLTLHPAMNLRLAQSLIPRFSNER